MRRRAVLTLLLVFLLLPEWALLAFFSAGTLLSLPAKSPHHADVVVVLGGGLDRYPRGRDLVLAGYAERMVLFEPNAAERQDALMRLPMVEIMDKVRPANSWTEAKVVRAWMQANGWHTALVVSDPPHLLRVAYAWSSAFRGTDLSYTLVSSDPPWWPGWRWWSNPTSAAFVESEVLKLSSRTRSGIQCHALTGLRIGSAMTGRNKLRPDSNLSCRTPKLSSRAPRLSSRARPGIQEVRGHGLRIRSAMTTLKAL
jgi:hypothetical protein